MVKVEKDITVTITGSDVDTLKNLAELARRFLDKHKTLNNGVTGEWVVAEFDVRQVNQMQELMSAIFEA